MENKNASGLYPKLLLILFVLSSGLFVQNTCHAQDFTNLFFLHHSVGNGLVVEGNMRGTIEVYNSAHGTHYGLWDHGYNSDGLRNPAGEETGINYDIPDDNTDPDGLFYLWTSSSAEYAACRERILANHQVIAFKSCYPASHIYDGDTLATYKNYYLVMREFFNLYPERLFVVMSTPPLHRLDTNTNEAYYARSFANWLKSSDYLSGHTNIVCFDLFDHLAGSDNFLKYEYESSHTDSDSHPNALADETVGPVFATFLIQSAAAYHHSDASISAPTNVSASAGTYCDKVRVAWNAVSGASTYLVYRSEVYDSSSAGLIATISASSVNDRTAAVGSLYYYWIKAQKADGTLSSFSLPAVGWRRSTPATSNKNRDLDGDGLMDPVVYCEVNGNWDALFSSTGYEHVRTSMGGIGYLPLLADFDGDRRADLGVYNASAGMFIVALSGMKYQSVYVLMGGEGFVPEPGDYDGDGLADPVVYSRSSGIWRARLSSANYSEIEVAFGGQQYRAVPADYDGDAKTDLAVCNEQTGLWNIMFSAGGYAEVSGSFGAGNGTAVPSDYDGDGKADPSSYYAETGLWEVWCSGTGYSLVSYSDFGGSGFIPCPGDYDGDGLADPSVYNCGTQAWRTLFSSNGYIQAEYALGELSSIPVGMPP